MIKVAVAGCCGRMGQSIMRLVTEARDLQLSAVFEKKEFVTFAQHLPETISKQKNILVATSAEEAICASDVLIDFTTPEATLEHLALVKKHKKKIVIGTTGMTDAHIARIKRVTQTVPVVFSPNMSVGVNLLFKLSAMVATVLDDEYDVEIVEAHHRHKKDAPSGTAAKIAEVIAATRKVSLAKMGVYGRKGMTGAREKGTIGVHAIRGGDVVGDHLVSFMADGERFELGHKASSRDAFAKGSVVAARFLQKKRKGLFNMQDVLGLQ